MKKLFYLAAIAMLTTIFIACKNNSDSPKGTLIEMGQAMKNFEFKNMLPFMCKENREKMEKALPQMEKMGDLIKGMMKSQMEKFNVADKSKYEFVNEKITGNTASLDVTNKLDNKTHTMHFVREDNKWLICEEMGNMGNATEKLENGISNLKNQFDDKLKNNKSGDIEKAKEMLNDPKMKDMMDKLSTEQQEKLKRLQSNPNR